LQPVVWLALWLFVTVCLVAAAILPLAKVPLYQRLGALALKFWRRLRPTPLRPAGLPIEEIAATLRRLQGWLDAYAQSSPIPGKATKVAAATLAYDSVLVEACRALDVFESLADTDGLDREAERLRIQAALEACGLVLGRRRAAGR
jgi:hypothetical protein